MNSSPNSKSDNNSYTFSANPSDDAKAREDIMRTTLTEGHSHTLHIEAGAKKMVAIRATLASRYPSAKHKKKSTHLSSADSAPSSNKHEQSNLLTPTNNTTPETKRCLETTNAYHPPQRIATIHLVISDSDNPSLSHKLEKINILQGETVLGLKQRIFERYTIAPHYQTLLFGEKYLIHDETKLSELNFKNEDVIFVTRRQHIHTHTRWRLTDVLVYIHGVINVELDNSQNNNEVDKQLLANDHLSKMMQSVNAPVTSLLFSTLPPIFPKELIHIISYYCNLNEKVSEEMEFTLPSNNNDESKFTLKHIPACIPFADDTEDQMNEIPSPPTLKTAISKATNEYPLAFLPRVQISPDRKECDMNEAILYLIQQHVNNAGAEEKFFTADENLKAQVRGFLSLSFQEKDYKENSEGYHARMICSTPDHPQWGNFFLNDRTIISQTFEWENGQPETRLVPLRVSAEKNVTPNEKKEIADIIIKNPYKGGKEAIAQTAFKAQPATQKINTFYTIQCHFREEKVYADGTDEDKNERPIPCPCIDIPALFHTKLKMFMACQRPTFMFDYLQPQALVSASRNTTTQPAAAMATQSPTTVINEADESSKLRARLTP